MRIDELCGGDPDLPLIVQVWDSAPRCGGGGGGGGGEGAPERLIGVALTSLRDLGATVGRETPLVNRGALTSTTTHAPSQAHAQQAGRGGGGGGGADSGCLKVLCCKRLDADGNELAGVALPDAEDGEQPG